MQPSNDERTLAALAHASIVANGMSLIGLVATAVIWATQRERSAYVRGHALQALLYQVGVLIVALILVLSWGMCLALSLLPIALRPELYPSGSLPGPFWLALGGMALPVIFGLLAAVVGLFGSLQAYRGKPFLYPIVGRVAQIDLQPTPAAAPAAEVVVVPPPTPPAEPEER